MSINKDLKEALIQFRSREKFSDRAWSKRGLNPSSPELSIHLSTFFDVCANQLIEAAQNTEAKDKLKKVLTANLALLKKNDYDTEEKEFICSLFEELANILGIDFSNSLVKWLYGTVLPFGVNKKI